MCQGNRTYGSPRMLSPGTGGKRTKQPGDKTLFELKLRQMYKDLVIPNLPDNIDDKSGSRNLDSDYEKKTL